MSTLKERTWECNPWVWVIAFKKAEVTHGT